MRLQLKAHTGAGGGSSSSSSSSKEKQCIAKTRDGNGVDESEIKRGASGCQADQNKHWISCRQRTDFSQTDTELDLLSSSKQQHQQNTGCECCLCLFCLLPSFSGPQLKKNNNLHTVLFPPFHPPYCLFVLPSLLPLLSVHRSNPVFVQSVQPPSPPIDSTDLFTHRSHLLLNGINCSRRQVRA